MTIWLGQEARTAMIESGAEFYPLETGGVLLGWRDGDSRIVVDVIGPGPRALHGRHAFVPDHPWQVEQIGRAFSESSGDLDYLGDWHTHPDGAAVMSVEDCSTLTRIARKVRAPIMLIAAGGPSYWSLSGWLQHRRGFFKGSVPEPRIVRVFDVPPHWPRREPMSTPV